MTSLADLANTKWYEFIRGAAVPRLARLPTAHKRRCSCVQLALSLQTPITIGRGADWFVCVVDKERDAVGSGLVTCVPHPAGSVQCDIRQLVPATPIPNPQPPLPQSRAHSPSAHAFNISSCFLSKLRSPPDLAPHFCHYCLKTKMSGNCPEPSHHGVHHWHQLSAENPKMMAGI